MRAQYEDSEYIRNAGIPQFIHSLIAEYVFTLLFLSVTSALNFVTQF